jgi:hypothetical protein
MTKLNEELDDEAMPILIAFQKSRNLSTRGKALNGLIKDYGAKCQLFR